MSDTTSKDSGKEESKQPECSVDFHVEARDEGRNINIVTRGGAKTGDDTVRQAPTQNQWVKKNDEPRKQFDAQKEKEIFKQARQEFQKEDIATTSTMQQSKEAPKYEMPPLLDHTSEIHSMGK
jgi:hypothetical protein